VLSPHANLQNKVNKKPPARLSVSLKWDNEMPIGTSLIVFKLRDFALFKMKMDIDFNLSGTLKLLCVQVAHLDRRGNIIK